MLALVRIPVGSCLGPTLFDGFAWGWIDRLKNIRKSLTRIDILRIFAPSNKVRRLTNQNYSIMANWAFVTYECVCRDNQQAQAFKKLLDELKSLPQPYAESDFGNLWMGCLVKALGGDPDEIDCRGKMLDYTIEGNIVTLNTEQAWSEQKEFRHLVEEMYPGMKIWYSSSEWNEGVFVTNDREGKFFSRRYYLEYDDDYEYFDTIEQAADYVGNIVGMDVDPNVEAINDAIEEYLEDDEDCCMNFYEFKIIDD